MRKLAVRVSALAVAVVAFAGCGSSKSSTTGTTAATTPTNAAVARVVALVPPSLKSRGTLVVAADASYAPNEFIAPDGHTVIGMDPDLMQAIGAVMGVKVKIVNATFAGIIPGLAAGKYDVGASSFTDTKEREKVVNFVDYFMAGTSFYAKTSANPGVSTLTDLCGKTVAVEKGTTEQEESEAQSKTCAKAGKKAVTVLSYGDQNGANLAVSSGRAELGMADSPVAAYAVKQSGGQFKLIGKTYGAAPYGLAIRKHTGVGDAVLAALEVLIHNGTYKRILTKWGLQAGAVAETRYNGAKA